MRGYAGVKGAVKPMKAGSFKDSVRKTVQLLVRDNIEVMFRGFQPMVLTQGDKVVRMILPEVGDDAPEELIEAMAGFIDHECGHIFYTEFARAQKLGDRKPLKAALLNIVEDIRLEKLLPRDLPGTKDNLERMYEKMIEKFWGTPIKRAIDRGATDEQMLSVCLVVSFRALAGQKVFQKHMDDNGYWRFMTPLLSRMPTLATDLQSLETYDDVVRVVEAVIDALDPKTAQQMDDDAAQQQQQQQQQQDQDDDDAPSSNCNGSGDADDEDQDGEPEDGEGDESEGDSDDAGDDEGNSSEGDEADEGEGGDGDEADDESEAGGSGEGDDDSEDADGGEKKDKDSKGGKGHGDGEGEDDGSDEEQGDCAGDEDEANPNEKGDGHGSGESGDDDGSDDSEGSGGGKSNRTITDAVKSLEATQRKVLYLHKSKRRSVERIAKQMHMSEDEVKATLKSARRSLVEYMTGDK
jgi:hypothetical protein